MTALSYRYGLGRPLDWGPDCEAELARMRALWNRLVEIEEEHRRAIHAATAEAYSRASARERGAGHVAEQARLLRAAAERGLARR